jgi:predicted ATPase/DNA-binding SARP family transcriptional activator
MPPHLVLQFLGLPQIYLNDQPVVADRRKAIALLTYLAVSDIGYPHQRYTRESLSALLWPDYEQAKAFSNLRRTIWEVHQALGENWLIADRESVHLNPKAEIDLDVSQFQDLLSQARQETDISRRIPLLVDATKLYRNHFLTGFSLKDAYPFNEWAFAESEELRHKLVDALSLLSEDYCTLGQTHKAIPHARRLTALEPLNETAHRKLMEVYLQAGQPGLALKQYQTCEQILRKELNLDPQPETRALYKKIRKREITPVHIEKQIETFTPRHNLPSQISTFVGREQEQEEIMRLVENNRLVTLAGVGGIGKTRLSLQVGQKLLNDYPNGIWFVALDSLSEPALVPQTVASVFDIRESRERPIIEILTNVLREKTTLLILDNCEHLLEACIKLIMTLLQNCPNLKILTTSREILNMQGEATYYLPSLSIPEDSASLEKLTEYESIQLFTQRAALARSSFRISKENAQTITDICRRVDGIPLGIELAAAHINILRTKEILKQLNESFSLLTTDSRIALPRHQTTRASLDWSWRLLSAAEQTFLQQLSVFAGGWTLGSAQAVCGGNTLHLISTLVKKSLIMVDRESKGQTRYRFHEIVRQYMRERLLESGEEENVRTRHLQYFLQLSGQAETGLRGPRQVEWISRLNDERDNIRAALEWADKTDVEAGLYLSGRLQDLWESLDMREGARWLTNFIQESESSDYPHAKAKALLAQGWLLIWFHQFGSATSAAQECLELFRACKDKQGEVDAFLLLGGAWGFEDDPAIVLEHQQRALALAQSLGDKWRQAKALLHLGSVPRDGQRSFTYWEEALALFREVGDWRELTDLLGLVSFFRVLEGDIEIAQKYLDEETRLQSLIKNTVRGESAKTAKSVIALMRGDYEQARALLYELATVDDKLGDRTGYLWVRVRLGYVALREGNLIEARRFFAESARDFQKDEDPDGVAFTLEGVAGIFVAVEQPELAARLIGWADATREKIGDPRPFIEQADVDKIIAACLAKMGEVAFSDAYDEGQNMSLDEAVAYALQGY